MASTFTDNFSGESANTNITAHTSTTGGIGYVEHNSPDMLIDDSTISGTFPDILSYTGDGVGNDFPYVVIDEDMDDTDYIVEADIIMNSVSTASKSALIVARGHQSVDNNFIGAGLTGGASGVRKLVLTQGITERGTYQFNFSNNTWYRVKLVQTNSSTPNEIDCEVFLDTGSGYVSRITTTITDSTLYARNGRVGFFGALPSSATIIGYDNIGVSLYTQTLSPSKFSGSTIYTPSISLGATPLSPPKFSGLTMYAPTISTGGVSVNPSKYSALSIHAPTVAPGTVTLSPGKFSGLTIHLPEIIADSSLLVPPKFSGLTIHNPTISLGGVTVNPPKFSGLTIHNPTVNATIAVSPPLFSGLNIYPPSIQASIGLSPPKFGGLNIYAPTVDTTITLSPEPFRPLTIYTPTIAYDEFLEAPLTQVLTIYAPTIVGGAAFSLVAPNSDTAFTVITPNGDNDFSVVDPNSDTDFTRIDN